MKQNQKIRKHNNKNKEEKKHMNAEMKNLKHKQTIITVQIDLLKKSNFYFKDKERGVKLNLYGPLRN